MNGCDNCSKRRDIQKECPWGGTYHYRGEHGEKIGICNAYEQESNADHIRSMTDEELAEVMGMICVGYVAKPCGLHNHGSYGCVKHIANWLKQPYKEV